MTGNPKVGEVREFREHKPVPLHTRGFVADEPIPLADLAIFGEHPELRNDTVTVKRFWDGEQWVRP